MRSRSMTSTPRSKLTAVKKTPPRAAAAGDPCGHRYECACLRPDSLIGKRSADHRGIRCGAGRPKFSFAAEEIETLIAMLRHNGELFEPEDAAATSPDPADTKFLQCAQAADAEFIITGNKRDFPHASYGATSVVSAGELLDRIAREI